MALYDSIGRTYDATRKADPTLTQSIARHLKLKPGARYLDIACGTGNYTIALQKLGTQMHGLELASTMLDQARRKSDQVKWFQGNAEALPFSDRSFDGATCTVAIHHMENLRRAFEEGFRVIKSGRFVIFHWEHAQMARYWLIAYFPRGFQTVMDQMPITEEVVQHLKRAGFANVELHPWEVPRDIQDMFLYSGKYRPEIYLDPAVRAGISTFAGGFINADETATGCARLEADIKSGRIDEVMAKYRHDLGDYLFLVATKD